MSKSFGVDYWSGHSEGKRMNVQRNCLILGYGRAGRRHILSATKQGFKVKVFDPYNSAADYHDESDIPWFLFDYAVIASPPDVHLAQLRLCLDNTVNVMCEKPLCSIIEGDFITLPEQAPVMVAYNWYYNKQVQAARGTSKHYHLFAQQTRVLPAWGIENDHLPHDIFIINYVSGGITSIKNTYIAKSAGHQEVTVEGKTRTGDFTITERVLTTETPRISRLNGIDLVPDPVMFDDMWRSFVAGRYEPSLESAIQVQNWLHEISNRLVQQRIP